MTDVSDLVTEVRSLADMDLGPASANNTVVTDAQILVWINRAYRDLYHIAIKASPDRFTSSTTITGDGSTVAHSLPSDFYRLRSVEYNSVTLKRIPFQDRNRYNEYQYWTYEWPEGFRYYLSGTTQSAVQKLSILPTAGNSASFTVYYIPNPVTLATTGNHTSIPDHPYWSDYICTSAAIKCLAKEESLQTAGFYRNQLKSIEEKLKSSMSDIDDSMPEFMADGW